MDETFVQESYHILTNSIKESAAHDGTALSLFN